MMTETKDTTYNGWTNYETWNVKLWIDNEQGSYEYWRERAQELWNDTTSGQYEWETREEMFTRNLADMLKDEHEENAPELSGPYADLMNAALGEVNWREIAQSYIEDVKENEPGADA